MTAVAKQFPSITSPLLLHFVHSFMLSWLINFKALYYDLWTINAIIHADIKKEVKSNNPQPPTKKKLKENIFLRREIGKRASTKEKKYYSHQDIMLFSKFLKLINTELHKITKQLIDVVTAIVTSKMIF